MKPTLFDHVIRVIGILEWILFAALLSVFGAAIALSARLTLSPENKGINVHWVSLWTTLGVGAALALLVTFKALLTGDAGIILKQMRQRALGTWLTLLSVLLGVALAVAVLLVNRESGRLFGQTDFGYELILGPPKGSKLTLVFNTVYHLEQSEGTIPYELYEQMASKKSNFAPLVRTALPFMVGDSYAGRRIVGTSPLMFGFDDAGNPVERKWEYRKDQNYEFAQGRAFHPLRFEAVIGSEVAASQKFNLYDPKLSEEENEKRHAVFKATHGMPGPNDKLDEHKPKWHIVGILKPSGTANDRVLFVPVVSLYAIEEHSYGMLAQALIKAGRDPTRIPAAELPDVLKKLGYNPDELPKSVMRKFHLAASSTKPVAVPVTPAPDGELLRPATPAPTPKPAVPDAGGELLKEAPKTPPAPAAGNEKAEAKDEDEDAYHLDKDGNIIPDLPKDEWELSAVLVKARGPFQADTLQYRFRVANTDAQAVRPVDVMRDFFQTFLKGSTYVLLALAGLVSCVAAISILVSIYNSVSARQREIAILRALGATRGKVLSLICLEAGFIGLVGGLLGVTTGHLLGAAGNVFFKQVIGEGINWWEVDRYEVLYLAAVAVVAVVAGLVPALKAYRVPVVTNLTAG